jgi:hypothetical protein
MGEWVRSDEELKTDLTSERGIPHRPITHPPITSSTIYAVLKLVHDAIDHLVYKLRVAVQP